MTWHPKSTQCDHFQQFYNRHNVKVHVPIIRWSHCEASMAEMTWHPKSCFLRNNRASEIE